MNHTFFSRKQLTKAHNFHNSSYLPSYTSPTELFIIDSFIFFSFSAFPDLLKYECFPVILVIYFHTVSSMILFIILLPPFTSPILSLEDAWKHRGAYCYSALGSLITCAIFPNKQPCQSCLFKPCESISLLFR
jgi:hypothetical protein